MWCKTTLLMKKLRFQFLRLTAVSVDGTSMSPSFNHGDWLLFRILRWPVAPTHAQLADLVGKVVLVRRSSEFGDDFLQIKRVIHVNESGIWVEGDNKAQSTDSRTWGYLSPKEIIAIYFLRYRRAR